MTPIISVMVDGYQIPGLIRGVIHTTSSYDADSFSLTIAVGSPPLTPISYWSSLGNSTVQIEASYNFATDVLLVGVLDHIRLDPLRNTVVIEGRDLSAKLIDSYWQQDFVNQTAGEVVTSICQQYGLTPVVTSTTDLVGRYYADGYTRLSLGQFSKNRSNWDVIVQLAREASFDALVNGWNLYFQPSLPQSSNPLLLRLEDVKSLHIESTLAFGDSPAIRLQSWNSQDMTAYTNQDQSSASLSNSPQPFLFSSANMTADQVDKSAARLVSELQRTSVATQFEMPWQTSILPRSLILLSGTYSDFDTYFEVESVEREFCSVTGLKQRVRAVAVQNGF